MVVKKPWRTRTMRRFFLVRVQVWRINAMLNLSTGGRGGAPWSTFKLPRDRSRFGRKVYATSGWTGGFRFGRPGRPGWSETEGHKRKATAGFMPSANAKDAIDERGKKEVSVRLYKGGMDPRLPVKKEERKKGSTGDRRRIETRESGLETPCGRTLHRSEPSNVAHVGPGWQGGSSASARQAATAIRFGHLGQVNDAPDLGDSPHQRESLCLWPNEYQPRAQSPAFLGQCWAQATTLNTNSAFLLPSPICLTRVCTAKSYLVQFELLLGAAPSGNKMRPHSAILCLSCHLAAMQSCSPTQGGASCNGRTRPCRTRGSLHCRAGNRAVKSVTAVVSPFRASKARQC